MPKVKQVRAAKDYPQFGITKGQLHYHWKRITGPRSSIEYRQLTPPKIEQLTSSDYRIKIHYLLEERGNIGSFEDAKTFGENVASAGQEEQDKFDGMPDGLQQGATGSLIEERASALNAAAEEIETIADEWEEALNEHTAAVEQYEAAKSRYDDAYAEWELGDGEEDEPEEPEEPDEFDPQEYLDRINDVDLEN